MQCKEIIQVIEATFPRTAALGFDNVGLLAGRSEKEVSRIYLALDATDVVIDRAIKEGADMLITHHPLLFSAVKKVTDEDFITRRIVKLIQNDISYYAMHTNYDVLGMAELSGKIMDLQNGEVLDVTYTDEEGNPIDKDTFLFDVSGEGDVVLNKSESYINSIEITNSQETEPEPTATPTPGRQPSVTPSQDNNTPGGGTSDNGGTTGRTSVKTGDNTPIGVWAGILAAAVVIGGAAGIAVKRKKKK